MDNKVTDNKVTIVGFLFLVLCLGLVGGVYYIDGRVRELRSEHDMLDQTRANMERDRINLQNQIRVFNDAFRDLEEYNVRAAYNVGNFRGRIQQEIDRNEIIVISGREGAINNEGRATHSLTLRGDYYAFMRMLAAWRNLDITVRVSSLSVAASRSPQIHGEIQADVILEAIIAN
jgi:hypothetical protein